jgi:hypothetical protein
MGEEFNRPSTPEKQPKAQGVVRTDLNSSVNLRVNDRSVLVGSESSTTTGQMSIVPTNNNSNNNPLRPHGVRRRRVDPLRDRRSTVARSDPSSSSSTAGGGISKRSSSNSILLEAVIRDLKSLGSGGQAINEHVIRYIVALRTKNLQLQPMGGDGNCLFRSVAHQIYGTESLHHVCRKAAADYMEAEADFFADFVAENGNEGSHGASGAGGFSMYLADIRKDGVWGDDPEVQALCEIYNRPAEIWAYDPVHGAKKVRVFHSASAQTPASSSSVAPQGVRASITNGENVISSSGSTTTIMASPTTNSSNTAVAAGGGGGGGDNVRFDNTGVRPPIRLSYFAGGHYDSLRITDIAAWESQLLSRETAGMREEQAIRAAKSRAASRMTSASASAFSSSSLPPEQRMISSALTMSDMEATENSTMQAALAASRAQWEAAQDDDLDAALFESYLQQSSTSSSSSFPSQNPSVMTMSSAMTTENDDENGDLARALMTSQAELEGSLEKEIESAKKESLLLSASQPQNGGGGYGLQTRTETDKSNLWRMTANLTEEEQMQCLLNGITVEQFLASRDSAFTTSTSWATSTTTATGARGGGGGGGGTINSSSEDAELALALLLSSQEHHHHK